VQLLVNPKLRAPNADTLEHIHDHAVKLDVIDRASQTIMTKVTGTRMIRLTTRATDCTIIKYTHTWIKEHADLGFVALIRGLRRDLHHGTSFDFIRG